MSESAPFPWFGAKSKAAAQIWRAFGPVTEIGNYVEPFFGSGAVWLGRPPGFSGWATANDLDGNVANFWRAMKLDPAAVAEAACWHVSECDLHARHLALVNGMGRLSARLMADPDYCEPRLAGWWAWGACVWIGSGWCSGEGPWRAEPDMEGVPVFTKGNGGKGVKRQLPQIGGGGRGVNRKLPHLGGGTGVNRQAGDTVADRLAWLTAWFGRLQDELSGIRIACGDWERICSPGTMTSNGIAAVVMDPPYSQTEAVYANDCNQVSGKVQIWCAANGPNPAIRIVLCGHLGEHHALEAIGWRCVEWDEKKGGGYQGADDRERLWLSPHCVGEINAQPELF